MVDFVFYGLKWVYDVVGIFFLIDDLIVEVVRLVLKRVFGICVFCCKEFILFILIYDIVKKLDLENFVVLCNVIMYVLFFVGFFRFDDVFRIRRSDIFFKEGFMVIKVLKSKND